MHAEVETFLRSKLVSLLPWSAAVVWEVGSLNVNGQARDLVPEGWATWVGFDYESGPGVDVQGDAIETMPALTTVNGQPVEAPTIIVSTEALEHCPNWDTLLAVMCDELAPGGFIVLTCAGTGRSPHAADGSGPPHPGEHYRNVSLVEVAHACAANGVRMYYGEEGPPGDTRFVGWKPDGS